MREDGTIDQPRGWLMEGADSLKDRTTCLKIEPGR